MIITLTPQKNNIRTHAENKTKFMSTGADS